MRKFLQLFGEPSLGKPDQDLQREIDWVKEWMDEIMPEDDVPVNGAVVFTGKDANLRVTGQSLPTMVVGDPVRHMKEGLKGTPVLTTAKQKELRRILDEIVTPE